MFRYFTLLILTIFMADDGLYAQLDASKNQELRFSFLGTTLAPPSIDDRLDYYGHFTNLSLTYLRRYKSSKYFLKTAINGKTIDQEQVFDGKNIGTTLWTNLNAFLGLEKQYQYKHFGAYFGGGIMGGFLDYQADLQFPDEVAVNDLNILQRYMGLSAELTLFTNVTDQLYLYGTVSMSTFYTLNEGNNSLVYNDYRGLDSALLLNGIGLAYKF